MSTVTTPEPHHSDAEAHHDPHLAHHFDNRQQQLEAATQGMWLFLATEILLFGGLFCAYAVYRANHPEVFIYAHHFLDKTLGAINTVVLLCSSFTMAAGVWAAAHGRRGLLMAMLALTLLGGFGFLGIKYVEYEHKWKHGLLWGAHYRAQEHGHAEGGLVEVAPGIPAPAALTPLAPAPADANTATADAQVAASDSNSIANENWAVQPADTGPRGLLVPGRGFPQLATEREVHNVQLFFAVYFGMTGLHGLHVIAGLAVIAWVLLRSARGEFGDGYSTPVHMVGLYWHVVDLIWIYLFPLLYLIH